MVLRLIKKNYNDWDSSYPGVELLPTGEIVTTTYGHWNKDEMPYIMSVRINLKEIAPIPQVK